MPSAVGLGLHMSVCTAAAPSVSWFSYVSCGAGPLGDAILGVGFIGVQALDGSYEQSLVAALAL